MRTLAGPAAGSKRAGARNVQKPQSFGADALDSDQGAAGRSTRISWSSHQEIVMPVPTEALPWLAAILVFFGVFVAAIGGTHLWTLTPPKD